MKRRANIHYLRLDQDTVGDYAGEINSFSYWKNFIMTNLIATVQCLSE